MPIHDWTRVDHGTFHDFHQGWSVQIRSTLNGGLLPVEYEAKVEQHTEDGIPDVLTLQLSPPTNGNGSAAPVSGPTNGLSSVATAPPKVQFTSEFQTDPYTKLRKTIVIRQAEDRIVALIGPFRRATSRAARDRGVRPQSDQRNQPRHPRAGC